MASIGIFYGSSTGNTEAAANIIQSRLEKADVKNIAGISSMDELTKYDLLILGSSTWGLGDLQDDWEVQINNLKKLDLSGKKVAFFGTGDQASYPDTFVDAMGILYDAAAETNASLIGAWPVDGYEHTESLAVRNGKFVGLALDEDNQADLTGERITGWVELIKKN
ncbi:flavodoxin FldA [Marispirochaeta aestuarii]|uniref:flavodoxin FldA n=1 Tax=Marispirochaeta aestuarii TaxID=1963862 RepID=UPI0029C6C6DE|nr:flavodoxin FldA [Marispirochaeta aestuarii]